MAERTDKRMDDLVRQVNADFARTDLKIIELRTEINALRTEMYRGLRDVRTEARGRNP